MTREYRFELKERIRKIINAQRQLNEQIYRLSLETEDPELQKTLSHAMLLGNDNINALAKLLARKCDSCG